jgi:hypothetical protein
LKYHTDPLTDVENHHLYRDVAGFTYNITLIRLMLHLNSNERFVLRLYESHITPHTYAVHLRYHESKKKKDANGLAMGELTPGGVVIAPIGSSWEQAFGAFKQAFKERTGLAWDDRLHKPPAGKMMCDGQKFFKYAKPKEGEPKGLMMPSLSRSP